MSLYRILLSALIAIVFAIPAFADDTASPSDSQNGQMMTTDAAQGQKINVNKASAKELMKVKGINAAKARAIVAYRKKNGDFKSIEDLSNVKGFKKANMKQIEEQLTVE